jgi:hypothetical protein
MREEREHHLCIRRRSTPSLIPRKPISGARRTPDGQAGTCNNRSTTGEMREDVLPPDSPLTRDVDGEVVCIRKPHPV